ncbi:hypothetical protein VIRA109638_15580 [Vibrio rarus]
MKYSSESIHATSTCLDILDNPMFETWTEARIDEIKIDLCEMIQERSHSVDPTNLAEHMVTVLKNVKSTGVRPSENQILESIQQKLRSTPPLPF